MLRKNYFFPYRVQKNIDINKGNNRVLLMAHDFQFSLSLRQSIARTKIYTFTTNYLRVRLVGELKGTRVSWKLSDSKLPLLTITNTREACAFCFCFPLCCLSCLLYTDTHRKLKKALKCGAASLRSFTSAEPQLCQISWIISVEDGSFNWYHLLKTFCLLCVNWTQSQIKFKYLYIHTH